MDDLLDDEADERSLTRMVLAVPGDHRGECSGDDGSTCEPLSGKSDQATFDDAWHPTTASTLGPVLL